MISAIHAGLARDVPCVVVDEPEEDTDPSVGRPRPAMPTSPTSSPASPPTDVMRYWPVLIAVIAGVGFWVRLEGRIDTLEGTLSARLDALDERLDRHLEWHRTSVGENPLPPVIVPEDAGPTIDAGPDDAPMGLAEMRRLVSLVQLEAPLTPHERRRYILLHVAMLHQTRLALSSARHLMIEACSREIGLATCSGMHDWENETHVTWLTACAESSSLAECERERDAALRMTAGLEDEIAATDGGLPRP